jgi:hypothetical protein
MELPLMIQPRPRDRNLDDDFCEQLRQNMKAPAKASGDAGSVEQHKLTDQIAADRHLASKDAVTKPKRGLRFNKLVPPGAAG